MNLSAIFSKTGKGVQEASGKTSHLSRADRAVLSAIDGKTSLGEVQKKFDKLAGPKFDALIQQLDKDGFIREVSSGTQAPAPRAAAPAAKAPPPPKADDGDEGLDFTQALKLPPKAPAAPKPPQQDLAAASRADAERRTKEKDALDYRGRQEAEAKAKAEAEQKARAAAEARARAEAEARTHAEAEAKVKAAREAAIRMATEAKAKAEAEARVKTESAERERQAAAEREREALERARREAEDKARLEAELNAKLDAERKARKELEEKAKREADELRQRLEAEMKAKLEEERRARDEEDRKRREEEDRRRKEEDERRAKAEAERRAKEEAERKQREEEDRKRREEEDRRRKEEDERRAKAEAERRAKEEAERRAKEEAERKAKAEAERKAKEEAERRAKEEAERKAREDADRKRREEEDRRRREEDERRAKEDAERKAREAEERRKREDEDRKRRAEDEERRARDERERKAKEEAEAKARAAASASLPAIQSAAPATPPPPPAAAADGGIGDSLLADLDSFTQREDEERQAKEEAERQAKEAAARKAKEAAERQAKEEAEKKRLEEEDRRRKEEEERRAREEEERRAREEEEQRKTEEAELKRKAKEALAARQTEERRAKAAAARGGKDGDDIGVSDDDLDMDEVKSDHKVLAARAAKIAQEQPAVAVPAARPRKLGKPVAIALFAILIAGVGLLHVVPMSTADYEKAASEAFGAPVRIGSARLSVITGIEVKFEGVSIGEAVKIRQVRGFPEIGSLFGARKSFSRIELEGLAISQSQVADAVLGKAAGENFRVGRVTVRQLTLEGPLKLPPLDVDAAISGDGSVQSLKLSGADKLVVQLSPKGSDIGFEISAGSLALPFLPALTLNEFGMKGTANRGGVTSSEFDGRAFDGVISGTARIRWGASWTAEGEVRARAVKVAVFAPALASEGKVEGRAAYTMSGSAPATLYEGARMQGEFKIEQGVLGSFDLTRALQTGGAQASGRTVFSELTGQGVYDKGAVQLRNVAIAAGAMNAGASLDIDPNGGLSGRIAAEVKTPSQTLRATLNVSGKVQEPVIRK